jgi:hypothetical protein
MRNPVLCGPCHTCKSDIWLPRELYDAAVRSEKISFFCPYGHEGVFKKGDSEADVLRRERDRLKQKIAEKDDAIYNLQVRLDGEYKQAKALRTAAAKAKKRSIAGTCPCCHRTFRQMALHMKNQHPEFKAEAVR